MRAITTAGLATGLVSAVAAAAFATAAPVSAAPVQTVATGSDVYVVTTDNVLRRYGQTNNNPLVLEKASPIRGLSGEHVLGIDTRPSTGVVYALSDGGRLYTLADDGRATLVGSIVGSSEAIDLDAGDLVDPNNPPPQQQGPDAEFAVGLDFDPSSGLIRLTTTVGLTVLLNPDTGLISGFGILIDDADGAAELAAAAYTDDGVFYGVDSRRDALLEGDGGFGASLFLATTGTLRINVNNVNGFDITGAVSGEDVDTTRLVRPNGNPTVVRPRPYQAIVSSSTFAQQRSTLFRVNLETGRAVGIGEVTGQVVGLTFAGAGAPVLNQS